MLGSGTEPPRHKRCRPQRLLSGTVSMLGARAAACNIRGTTEAAVRPHSAGSDRIDRFCKHLLDLRDYLRNNWTGLTNYAHAYRHRLRISSAPAESGMSHLVNQRMGKRQPMCWSLEGAHFLLQVRRAVLDGRLETLFREWHPRFRLTPPAVRVPAM